MKEGRGRQSGVDLKPPQASVVKSNGGERGGKVGTRTRQARLREASASEPLQKCRKRIRRCQNRGGDPSSGISLGGVLRRPNRLPHSKEPLNSAQGHGPRAYSWNARDWKRQARPPRCLVAGGGHHLR